MSLRHIGAALLVMTGLLWAAWSAGQIAGRAEGAASCARANTQDMQEQLDQSRDLLRQAGATSTQLFQQIKNSVEQNLNTTRELRDALTPTANERVDCRFPDSVMQQLDAARLRATEATTGGLGATLPVSGGSG